MTGSSCDAAACPTGLCCHLFFSPLVPYLSLCPPSHLLSFSSHHDNSQLSRQSSWPLAIRARCPLHLYVYRCDFPSPSISTALLTLPSHPTLPFSDASRAEEAHSSRFEAVPGFSQGMPAFSGFLVPGSALISSPARYSVRRHSSPVRLPRASQRSHPSLRTPDPRDLW